MCSSGHPAQLNKVPACLPANSTWPVDGPRCLTARALIKAQLLTQTERPIKAHVDTAWVSDWLPFLLVGPLSIATRRAHRSEGRCVWQIIKLLIPPPDGKMDTDVKMPEKLVSKWLENSSSSRCVAFFFKFSFLHVKTCAHSLSTGDSRHFTVLRLARSFPTLSFWLIHLLCNTENVEDKHWKVCFVLVQQQQQHFQWVH